MSPASFASPHKLYLPTHSFIMPRKGRKWIDPKNSTKFQLVHRSYEDPRYGDSQATVRILAPIENPNIARKRLPDAYYEQQEKIIELVEGFNQAATGGDGEDADEERLMASKQQTGRRVHREEHDDDEDSDDDRYYDEEDEDDDEEGHDGAAHEHGDEEEDADRFADADEDEDDDLPPLEEDERKKAPAQKSAAAKDVKGKAKPKGKAGVNAQEFELGEYGFDSNYNYAQHFKPMGVSGGVFMEAPVPKGAPKKGQKPAFALREDEEKEMMGKILTTDIVDFLDDADIPDEIPDDVLAALNDPEAFESLTDDFIVAAGDEEADGDEDQGAGRRGKRRPSRKVHFDDEDDGEYGEEDYDQDEDDEDLDALLEGLKANPEGNKRRERNEHEQIFDARFERALAEFDDDEIGELEQEAEEIKGMTTMDQLGPVLKEFISSRRRVKGIIGKKATGDDDTKSVSGASQKSQAGDRSRASQAGDAQGEESEGEEEDDTGDEFVFVEAEEPRDQWDCESITTTYTNTENHPTLIDDGPLVSRRRPPIVLSKKTGIPLGVLPTTQPKVKHTEEQPAVNLGQARKKEETKEEKRARKQQIKEARKANRERKKEIKGAFKEEELRQLNMQAKGQGQRIIRLK